jgi:acetylornithine deacetylase
MIKQFETFTELECAIVGEPTLMQLVSRKGLLVLDVIVKVPPVTPHNNPDNPIYNAIPVMNGLTAINSKKYRRF